MAWCARTACSLAPVRDQAAWRRSAVFQYSSSATLDLAMAWPCCPQQGSPETPGQKDLLSGASIAFESRSVPSPLSCVRKISGITRGGTRLLDSLAQETVGPCPLLCSGHWRETYLRHSHQRAAFETPMDCFRIGTGHHPGSHSPCAVIQTHILTAVTLVRVLVNPVHPEESHASRRGNVCGLEAQGLEADFGGQNTEASPLPGLDEVSRFGIRLVL